MERLAAIVTNKNPPVNMMWAMTDPPQVRNIIALCSFNVPVKRQYHIVAMIVGWPRLPWCLQNCVGAAKRAPSFHMVGAHTGADGAKPPEVLARQRINRKEKDYGGTCRHATAFD